MFQWDELKHKSLLISIIFVIHVAYLQWGYGWKVIFLMVYIRHRHPSIRHCFSERDILSANKTKKKLFSWFKRIHLWTYVIRVKCNFPVFIGLFVMQFDEPKLVSHFHCIL